MDMSPVALRFISDLLERRTGQQVSAERHWRIGTALGGVFRERGISNIDQLVCLLADPREGALANQVVEALLNNETYFYRDHVMFDHLAGKVLPEIAHRRNATRTLRIWSAGCSTGQETYSLAMLFRENAAQWEGWTIQIVGTDISRKAIESARRGLFSQFAIQRGLGVKQMVSHFEDTRSGWQARPDLRAMVKFEVRNILHEPPGPGAFDLILCRNVLLYFAMPTRRQVFARLSAAAAADGWLMLGAGETVIGQTDLFGADGTCQGLYRPVPPGGTIASAARERTARTPLPKAKLSI